jgi:capsular polysaccharide biosynthesis protein
LFIGTRAPYNWYHWIANVLPALHVANEGNIPRHIPLILPDEIRSFPQMMESLSVFLDAREIVWLGQDRAVQVDSLFWADSPVYDAPFSRDQSKRQPLTVHAKAMDGYKNKILDYSAPLRKSPSRSKKIFLARSPAAARPYNSAEVEGWAQELGFTLCLADQLTFPEQVDLFRRATHIVGPTGAAWSGIMFAQPRLRALRLTGGAAPYENYFANLATISGAAIYDLPGETANLVDGESRFKVNKESFFEAIHVLLGHP